MLAWKKQPDVTLKTDVWLATLGPFAVKVAPKGDGRWNWEIIMDDARSPAATGIGNSLGAAKTACELYVGRSGRV